MLSKLAKSKLNQAIKKLSASRKIKPENFKAEYEASPRIMRQWITREVKSADFLRRVDTQFKREKAGEVVSMGVEKLISRTNKRADKKYRRRGDPSDVKGRKYEMEKLYQDTEIPHDRIDDWAEQPNFLNLWRNAVHQKRADEIQMIGFHGKTRAEESDPEAHPMGEDLAVGWLQRIREYRCQSDEIKPRVDTLYVNEVTTKDDEISDIKPVKIGDVAGADFKNIHELVKAMSALVPEHLRSNLELVISQNLLDKDDVAFYRNKTSEVEKEKREKAVTLIGGYPPSTAKHFPSNAVLLADLDQLKLMFYRKGTRTSTENSAELESLTEFCSHIMCYEIDNGNKVAFAEKIYTTATPDPAIDSEKFDPENAEHWVWSE